MKTLQIILSISVLGLITACSSKQEKADADRKDLKVEIMSEDVRVSGGEIEVEMKVKCLPGETEAILQIGNFYKTFPCQEAGMFSYIHKFPTSRLKKNRDKRKDYVLRVRAYHPNRKKDTLAQSLIVISYKDFQSKLVINQALLTVKEMKGLFSDLSVYGQCRQGSKMEVELYDDIRGVTLEEDNLTCGEAGFSFYTRRPGRMKKGTRLLLRETIGDKPLASYEVVLFF